MVFQGPIWPEPDPPGSPATGPIWPDPPPPPFA